jgi:hypothetical protein
MLLETVHAATSWINSVSRFGLLANSGRHRTPGSEQDT